MSIATRLSRYSEPCILRKVLKFLVTLKESNKGEIYYEFDDNGIKNTIKLYEHRQEIIIELPSDAKKLCITSKHNLSEFNCRDEDGCCIISIEHYESNTLYDLTRAFCNFTNLKEFKHFDVTCKVTNASHMCSGWKNFNGIIPEGFCSIFDNLKNARNMFSDWHSFNQPLPEGFFSIITNLKYARGMFFGWRSYNQLLPDTFFCNARNIIEASSMFKDWFVFNKPVPDMFFHETVKLTYISSMFENWSSFNQKIPEYFLDNMEEVFSAEFVFCGWNSCEYDLPPNIIRKLDAINEKFRKRHKLFYYGWIKNKNIYDVFKIDNYVINDYKEEDLIERDEYIKTYFNEKYENFILMEKLKNNDIRHCVFMIKINDNVFYILYQKHKNEVVFSFIEDYIFQKIIKYGHITKYFLTIK